MMKPCGLRALACAVALTAAIQATAAAAEPPRQAFLAQARRVVSALERLGEPLRPDERAALRSAEHAPDDATAVAGVERVLDARCLFVVSINPEMRVSVAHGAADPLLAQGGWRAHLVKVRNDAGATGALRVVSPHARAVHDAAAGRTPSDEALAESPAEVPPPDAWLDLDMADGRPLEPTLGGLPVEYRIVQLYSRDAGPREATVAFDLGPGTRDVGPNGEVAVLFRAAPAREITLRITEDGRAAAGSLVIRDPHGRVHPSLAKRLAPDFPFHPQIYRENGDRLQLPEGRYAVEFRRGPESLPEVRQITVDARTSEWSFAVQRWVDPAARGWWSGDHHIHAAGCSHYSRPTEGVRPSDMALHCRGEDLKVGAVLTWGPGFDYQSRFFCGKEDAASVNGFVVRYDLEVSGFGSYKSGHLCLLRLREQHYPGTTSVDGWPTLGLNTIRWAKAQGALVGTAHSGWGLQPVGPADETLSGPLRAAQARVVTQELPNHVVPPYNGVGANEYIVDVTHEVPGRDGRPVPAVDFLALGDTPYPWELNIWYHTLNAGFRSRAAGETDFPCIYDERVGLARSYVKLDGALNYDGWCEGLRAGRSYVSDGFSHLMDFRVDDREVGVKGSELALTGPREVTVSAQVAALLPAAPVPGFAGRPPHERPYWNVERARRGASREVAVEVVVNGQAVASRPIVADGSLQPVTFAVAVSRSSWIALRILGSSHTNPIFALVDGRPIRASRRSVQWCLDGVDRCWSQKERFIAAAELPQAREDYAHARAVYRSRLAECDAD